MSKTGVYMLRNAPGSDDFRRAWDAAIEDGVAVLKSVAFERAIDGIEETAREKGKVVRTIRRFDNHMLTRLLAIYDTPARADARANARAFAAVASTRTRAGRPFQGDGAARCGRRGGGKGGGGGMGG